MKSVLFLYLGKIEYRSRSLRVLEAYKRNTTYSHGAVIKEVNRCMPDHSLEFARVTLLPYVRSSYSLLTYLLVPLMSTSSFLLA